jgi:hypothetical protein
VLKLSELFITVDKITVVLFHSELLGERETKFLNRKLASICKFNPQKWRKASEQVAKLE